MIKRQSPLSLIASFVALVTIIAVNALGLWHLHPPSDRGAISEKSYHFASLSFAEPQSHPYEHAGHHPGHDKEEGCDFCWLQAFAKTSLSLQTPQLIAPDLLHHTQWWFPSFPYLSFLDKFSFLVRGPPVSI